MPAGVAFLQFENRVLNLRFATSGNRVFHLRFATFLMTFYVAIPRYATSGNRVAFLRFADLLLMTFCVARKSHRPSQAMKFLGVGESKRCKRRRV